MRFALSAPLLGAAYCHCTRCQKRTGGGSSLSALAAPGSFTLTAGEEQVGTWDFGEDGFGKSFCRECGSHLFGTSPDGTQVVVRMSAVDGDPGVRPIARQFVADAAVWDAIPDDGLRRFEGRMQL